MVAILISFLVFLFLGVGGFFAIPKSADQLVYRTSLVLTIVCCWTMWAVTYLAQINPLIVPERSWARHSEKPSHGRARELEEKRINKELANIRSKFKDPKLKGYQKKKYVCKLLYMYILGWEIDFGHMEAIQLLSSPLYTEKQIGYLAATLLFSETNESARKIVDAIANDLAGSNEVHCCLALHAIANIGSKLMAESLLQQAALCLLRLYRKFPDVFQAVDLAPRIIDRMDDPDLGVALSVSTLVLALAQHIQNPTQFDLMNLQLVIDKDFTADYVYYKVPSPWLQVKLLRLLQGSCFRASFNDVMNVILRNSQEVPKNVQHNNAQNAVLFETINLAIHLDPTLISDQCRYLGLETMAHLAATGSEVCLEAIKKSQDTIIASLRDKVFLCAVAPWIFSFSLPQSGRLCDERGTSFEDSILAEKFAMEYSWYVDVVLQLITVAGDHVSDEIWFRALRTPSCHETAVKVGGYLLGEFGHLIANSPGCPAVDDVPENLWNLFPEIRDEVLNVFRQLKGAMDVEIQQRAIEYFSLSISEAEDLLQVICEEMPPFPERDSALVMRLLKKIEDTEDKRTGWLVVAMRTSKSLVARPEGPQPTAPRQPPRPPTPDEEDLKPLAAIKKEIAKRNLCLNSCLLLDTFRLGDELVLYHRLLLTGNGLLHRDMSLEVGIKTEYHDNVGATGSRIFELIPDSTHLVQAVPAVLPAGSQFNQVYDIERAFWNPSASIALRLPVAITKFMTGVENLSGQDFIGRWRQIGGPPRESQCMFKPPGPSFPDVGEIRRAMRGLGFAVLEAWIPLL
ncbi:armadillo-type protein [Chytridium lagenaria]|nr:armadillo-type protein [Chytridium lagenaria]